MRCSARYRSPLSWRARTIHRSRVEFGRTSPWRCRASRFRATSTSSARCRAPRTANCSGASCSSSFPPANHRRARAMSGASSLVYTLLARSGIAHALRRRDAAPIFCFHNVVNDAIAGRQGDPSLHIGLSPFKALLDLIVSQYTVIPLLELAARLRSGRSLRATASLTFDDAYHGALTHAVPVLKRLALPATVFIVTDAADRPRPFWWDVIASTPADVRGNYLRDLLGDGNRILNQVSAPSASLGSELLPADWPTLHAMLDATVVPGSHTLTHRNLSDRKSVV